MQDKVYRSQIRLRKTEPREAELINKIRCRDILKYRSVNDYLIAALDAFQSRRIERERKEDIRQIIREELAAVGLTRPALYQQSPYQQGQEDAGRQIQEKPAPEPPLRKAALAEEQGAAESTEPRKTAPPAEETTSSHQEAQETSDISFEDKEVMDFLKGLI